MPVFLNTAAPDFEAAFQALLGQKREEAEDVDQAVAAIIADVRARGDQAVIDGALVNGSWKLVGWVAGVVRRVQTGYVYHYALVMILGIFVLMTYFVWLNK